MTDFTAASIATTASEEEAHDQSLKTVVLFCCAGLFVSLLLMTFGIDLGLDWI